MITNIAISRLMAQGRGRQQAKTPSRKKKRSTSAPPTLESPRKRLKWKNESMIGAMEAVKRGISVKRAAEEQEYLEQCFRTEFWDTFNTEKSQARNLI